jgi:hypothetical protein
VGSGFVSGCSGIGECSRAEVLERRKPRESSHLATAFVNQISEFFILLFLNGGSESGGNLVMICYFWILSHERDEGL